MAASKPLSGTSNKKLMGFFAAYFVILIAWKTALWLYLPLPTTDGVQSLSHTYSILRGDFFHSVYWHNWMAIYQLPYGYGVVTAPLMALLPFGTVNNFFVAALVFTLVAAALAYATLIASPACHTKGFAALVAAAVFVYPHLWVMRPEGITIPLLLMCLLLLWRFSENPRLLRLAAVAFLVVLAGLTHPIAGLLGVLLVSLMAYESRWQWRHLFYFYGLIALFLGLLYLPVILLNVDLWVQNFLGFFTREEPRGLSTLVALAGDFPRFVGWGAPLLFLYGRALALSWRQPEVSLLREGVLAALFLIPIVIGRGGAYFTYMLVFFMWRLGVLPRVRPVALPVAAMLLLVAPFWTHYFPTFQNVENPRYGETVRAIMDRVDTYSGREESGTLWLSTRFGLPIIDEPYARVLANYYAVRRYPQPIALKAGDEILYANPSEEGVIFDNYAVTRDDAQIENLVPPVPGLLTFESLLRERLPDLGLWRLTARQAAPSAGEQ